MRILIINQPYWPDVVATAQHLADWTEYLVSQGHEVTVIASRSVYGKQGAVLPKREEHKGVKIFRVGANLFSKGRILTRLVDFALFHVLALWRGMWLKRQDVVVCLTTPPFVGVVGVMLKVLKGSRYVQYEMDLYPDVPVALGVMRRGSLATRVFEWVHRVQLRWADKVVVLGRCMWKVIAGKGIEERKLVLVTPWADPEEIVPVRRGDNYFLKEHGLEGKRVVMYSGNLGLGHDVTTLCAAMKVLGTSGEERDEKVAFVFIGGGKRMLEIEKFVEAEGLKNVRMLKYQPRERLAETLSAADVHLITQAPGTTGLIVPSKFYGILAAGRRSIYIGPGDTEVAMVLRERGLGEVLEKGDVEGLLRALRGVEEGGGAEEAARECLRLHYSRGIMTRKLTEGVVG